MDQQPQKYRFSAFTEELQQDQSVGLSRDRQDIRQT